MKDNNFRTNKFRIHLFYNSFYNNECKLFHFLYPLPDAISPVLSYKTHCCRKVLIISNFLVFRNTSLRTGKT